MPSQISSSRRAAAPETSAGAEVGGGEWMGGGGMTADELKSAASCEATPSARHAVMRRQRGEGAIRRPTKDRARPAL